MRIFVALALLSLSPLSAFATIYGEDSLIETRLAPSAQVRELARSVAVQVRRISLTERVPGITSFTGSDLLHRGLCEDQRFVRQPVNGTCSGFLVAPNLLLTAGHCVTSDAQCADSPWVFDYAVDSEDALSITVPSSSVYYCTGVIQFSYEKKLDFALIRLDRPVTDRAPLPLSPQPLFETGREIFTLSSPRGLPLKYSTGRIRGTDDGRNDFSTNLDSMRGSSGAPVLDKETGTVIGIVARGDADLEGRGECNAFKRCDDHDCMGEEATRVDRLPFRP